MVNMFKMVIKRNYYYYIFKKSVEYMNSSQKK